MNSSPLPFSLLLLISFCSLFSFFPPPLHAQSVSESDSLALVALYNSTNGDEWTRNDNWLEEPVSSWYGVTVVNGRVNKIHLGNNNLEGNIPNQIGDLTGLTDLNLWRNKLFGNIPASIGNLTNLISLFLYSNDLEGAIPEQIGNLTNLILLFLYSNDLEGVIPEQIGNLTQLRGLNLFGNKLSGSIPSSIGNLINLSALWLQRNDLEGSIPTEIENLRNLEELNLHNNLLSGNLPNEIGGLNNLKIINVTFNDLSGPLPKSLGSLTNLEELHLGGNNFSGILPPELGNLTSLKKLLCMYNQFTGPIPSEFGKLSQLEQLWIDDNMLTGEVPQGIFQLPKLHNISLELNQLTKLPLPSNTDHISSLRTALNKFTFEDILPFTSINDFSYYNQAIIDITDSLHFTIGENFTIELGIDESVPDNVYKWTRPGSEIITNENKLILNNISLEDAGYYSCIVTNPRAPELTLSTNELYISVSQPSGKSVSESDSLALVALYNSTNGEKWTRNDNWLKGRVDTWYGVKVDKYALDEYRVTQLNLKFQNLNGIIPPEIGNLTKLSIINLSINQLEGEVPKEIGNLEDLNHLYLSNNKLTGEIPPEIWQMKNLSLLSLDNNELKGELPSEISNLEFLSNLDLRFNQLSGNIPPEIFNLSDLQYLNLGWNQFTGSISAEIKNLDNLEHLVLSSNKLSGRIPPEIGMMSNLRLLWLFSNNLSGTIPLEIFNLSGLQDLSFGDNELEGIIPIEIQKLSNLTSLILSSNKFSGTIPPELGELEKLETLNLGGNQLSGTIPPELANLKSIAQLTLSYNDFTGKLPSSFAAIDSLYSFSISHNYLTELPDLSKVIFYGSPYIPIQIQNNSLTFKDIIPNLSIADSAQFIYSPQDSIGQAQTISLETGESFTIDLGIDADITTNEYRWFKDSVEIAVSNQNSFSIAEVMPSDAGVYTCTVTNPAVDSLTLYSRPVTLLVKSEPLAHTITFDSLPNKTFGDAPFKLSATSDAGLEVFYEVVSGSASLYGDSLSLNGAGTVTIKAFNPGNENYLPDSVVQSFTIAKAAQTITFDSIPDKILGEEAFALVASASSGLPVSFAVEGPASVEDGILSLTDTGKVSITASQPGNENYLAAEAVTHSFLVKAATFRLSGKVVTEAGNPAGSGAVILYTPNEAGRLTTFATTVLQAGGTYQFSGLKAGKYSVGVVPDDEGLLTTYLGNGVILAEAAIIEISKDIENQNITLATTAEGLSGTSTISGILILEEGNSGGRISVGTEAVEGTPLAEVAVYLLSEEGKVVATDVTDTEGKFTFANTPEGAYHFKADYEGMPHDADNFKLDINDKDMEVTAVAGNDGLLRLQEVSVITSTDDELIQSLVLPYPNPTKGKFSMLLDNHWIGGSMSIHNLHGQRIAEKEIQTSTLNFDLSPEQAGVYVITLKKGESWQVLRVGKL